MSSIRIEVCRQEWAEAKARHKPKKKSWLKKFFDPGDEEFRATIRAQQTILDRRDRFGRDWYDRYTQIMLNPQYVCGSGGWFTAHCSTGGAGGIWAYSSST